LLKNDLRKPNFIGLLGLSPNKRTFVFTIPVQEFLCPIQNKNLNITGLNVEKQKEYKNFVQSIL
jgi:hypothetical protein